MKNKTKKKIQDKENMDLDRNDILDTNMSGGADTLDTHVEKKTEENNSKKKKKSITEWIKPRRSPTTKEQSQLFSKALELILTTCMDNHVYLFESQMRVQKQGGPIGLKLTGEIADCLMIDWDKKNL